MNQVLLFTGSHEKGNDVAFEADSKILVSVQVVNGSSIVQTFYARSCLLGDLQAWSTSE